MSHGGGMGGHVGGMGHGTGAAGHHGAQHGQMHQHQHHYVQGGYQPPGADATGGVVQLTWLGKLLSLFRRKQSKR